MTCLADIFVTVHNCWLFEFGLLSFILLYEVSLAPDFKISHELKTKGMYDISLIVTIDRLL